MDSKTKKEALLGASVILMIVLIVGFTAYCAFQLVTDIERYGLKNILHDVWHGTDN